MRLTNNGGFYNKYVNSLVLGFVDTSLCDCPVQLLSKYRETSEQNHIHELMHDPENYDILFLESFIT